MMINKILVSISFILVFSLFQKSTLAQTDTSQSSFLSQLYFPFDFGYTLSQQKSISNGGQVKTGLEYRIKKESGLFLRFNFDNRNHQFEISENTTTNVVKGDLKFDDYVIGVGYRIGNKKIKGIGLCQAGVSTYSFPSVTGISNNFKMKENEASTIVFKTTLGLEYYVAPNAALTIETVYILHTSKAAFWNKSLSKFGISIGLTTTLF
jgi:hypothetical protein